MKVISIRHVTPHTGYAFGYGNAGGYSFRTAVSLLIHERSVFDVLGCAGRLLRRLLGCLNVTTTATSDYLVIGDGSAWLRVDGEPLDPATHSAIGAAWRRYALARSCNLL